MNIMLKAAIVYALGWGIVTVLRELEIRNAVADIDEQYEELTEQ